MDLFKIGEHIGELSSVTRNKINVTDIRGIIDISNIIDHGYQQVDTDIIWNTIKNDCPRLVVRIKELIQMN